MPASTIYLDHNATTPLDPQVRERMAEVSATHFANPASQHALGRAARRLLEDAREQIGSILGAKTDDRRPDRVLLSSGATESNQLALRGLAGKPPGRILVSAIEHPSLFGAADDLAAAGFEVVRLPVDANCVVRVEVLAELLDEPTRLVSVMLGNHETGALQPVAEIARLCHAAGVPLHTDASQIVGKLPVDFGSLGVTSLSASGHKFHGPSGCGLLLVRSGVELAPLWSGGFQQDGLRPGTESVVLAAGLCEALRLWESERDERAARLASLRDEFEQLLLAGADELVIHSRDVPRLPHVSNIGFGSLDRQAFFMALDLASVACSTGSACASGSSEPSPVLTAMGCEEVPLNSSLRFSLGCSTTAAEVREAAARILRVYKDLREAKRPPNSAIPAPQSEVKTV